MTDSTILEARQLAFLDQPRNAASKPWHLPDEHFCEAIKAELAGVPHRAICAALIEAGLPEGKVPGRTQWSEFWSQFKPFLRLARRRSAASGANDVASEAAKSPAEFDTATLDLIRQLAFELADSEAPDPKGVKSLVSLLLKHREHDLKKIDQAQKQQALAQRDEQIAFEKEKWRFDAAKAALEQLAELKTIAANRSLSEDAKIEQVMLRLWGAAPKPETPAP